MDRLDREERQKCVEISIRNEVASGYQITLWRSRLSRPETTISAVKAATMGAGAAALVHAPVPISLSSTALVPVSTLAQTEVIVCDLHDVQTVKATGLPPEHEPHSKDLLCHAASWEEIYQVVVCLTWL